MTGSLANRTRLTSQVSLLSSEVGVHVSDNAPIDLWEEYCRKQAGAELFHDWRWGKVIRDTHRYAPIYLTATQRGETVGTLMLMDVKSSLFGRSLVSVAFTVGGGILADTSEAAAALAHQAWEEGEQRGVKHVELRSNSYRLPGWVARQGAYVGFTKTLPRSADEALKSIPRKRRAEVRKAMKFAQEGRVRVNLDADLETFYRLYAYSLRGLGTPVFAKSYIKAIKEAFGNRVRFSVVEGDGVPCVGLCTFYFRDRVMPYYIGMTEAARGFRAGDLVYWQLMEDAVANGHSVFDFGRSKVGSPHELYKKTWGFEPVPLDYQYALIDSEDVPNISPSNPKFALATKVWQRLPLWAANRLGPVVARNLA
ncbi:MAG: FemAB family XrtA/PEP-CTERM system-associated protein [Pseudomonadota bacterium]